MDRAHLRFLLAPKSYATIHCDGRRIDGRDFGRGLSIFSDGGWFIQEHTARELEGVRGVCGEESETEICYECPAQKLRRLYWFHVIGLSEPEDCKEELFVFPKKDFSIFEARFNFIFNVKKRKGIEDKIWKKANSPLKNIGRLEEEANRLKGLYHLYKELCSLKEEAVYLSYFLTLCPRHEVHKERILGTLLDEVLKENVYAGYLRQLMAHFSKREIICQMTKKENLEGYISKYGEAYFGGINTKGEQWVRY